MKRTKEEFLEKIDKAVKLKGKNVLEIGCGMGSRSVQIASKVKQLTAIEPSANLIKEAKQKNGAHNIDYQVGRAEKLNFKSKLFDTVIFTLSLHHVTVNKMSVGIKEAVRVTRKGGHIVFLEPTHLGNFFESEIKFDACDGDERKEKALAYFSILNNKSYTEIVEIPDETIFQFDSVEDFISSMGPKKNKTKIKNFLEKNNYTLSASRRINIFQV